MSRSMAVDVCVLFCFRGGKKAPTEPRVQAIQQVAVPCDMEMSYSSASNFDETEDISDEGEDFSLDTARCWLSWRQRGECLSLLIGSNSPSCQLWSSLTSFLELWL